MKNIFKATFAVAAVAAIGMGSYKAYGSYVATNMSEDDLLLAENVEAISQMIESTPTSYLKKTNIQPCFKYTSKFMECEGDISEKHTGVYNVSYPKEGESFDCVPTTYIPSPWQSKPADQCSYSQQCTGGAVHQKDVPEEYKNGKVQEKHFEHPAYY